MRWQRLYERSMEVLAGNLAVAGALCAAFDLGEENVKRVHWFGRSHWRPNIDGRVAP